MLGLLRLGSEFLVCMASFASPMSVSITETQLAWLEQRRLHGALSRSAVLRQVLDAAMAAEQGTSAVPSGLPGAGLAAGPYQPRAER